nr:hypothetical protein [uncultured Sphaerochaeta sp.]
MEKLLKELGVLKLKESEITRRISELDAIDRHECKIANSTGWRTTQLEKYFGAYKDGEISRACTFAQYCERRGVPVCPACKQMLDAINKRKAVRRSIATVRGHITRLAVKLAKESA